VSRPVTPDPAAVAALVRAGAGIQLVVLFGSSASGRARPGSDVDVAVLGGGLWDQLGVASDVAALLGREPDPVDLGTASDWLRFEVARRGALLFEDEPGRWHRFQAEAMLRWFDLAPIVARCAEGVRRRLARDTAPRDG
jgi:predicted nucleotidyltransferase